MNIGKLQMTVMPTYCNKYLTKAHEWQQLLGYFNSPEKFTVKPDEDVLATQVKWIISH